MPNECVFNVQNRRRFPGCNPRAFVYLGGMIRFLAISWALAFVSMAPAQQAPGSGWDAAYMTDTPSFRQEPNGFLASVIEGVEPGRALDVGMGQGRNTLFLARQGWRTSGFDVSEAGVSQAIRQASEEGLEIEAVVESFSEFDWGEEQWDLIVVAYFPFLRQSLAPMLKSLRPGGSIVVEAYQAEAALDRPPGPGPGVTFATNELLKLFADLRVLEYQDVRAEADWGLFETRLVRLHARKD